MIRINMLIYMFVLLAGIFFNIAPVYAGFDFNFFGDKEEVKTPEKKASEDPKTETKETSETETKKTPETEAKDEQIQNKTSNKENVKKADAPHKSFSETLAENMPKEKKDDSKTDDRENWLESLISKGTNEIFKSQDEKAVAAEKKRIQQVLMNRRSNAANFDISGIKLRMSPEEVEQVLLNSGFRRITQEKSIPNFIKWRADELCRIHGVVGFERLANCARMIAQTNGFEYVFHETYNRYTTRETIDVLYTSTFTDNLAHQINYKSDLPLFASRASQHVYINNLKIYDFWRRIDEKYGKPDNVSEVKWGLGGKKPYMKASTGNLELSDPILKNLDISRMMNEDTRLSNTPYYSF